MTAAIEAALADPQQTIAELRRQLDECRAELAARNSEYGERIEHQSATVDVLKVMSASPGDPQPVFDLIVERARDLCDGYGVTVYEFDGTLIHWRAATGVSDDPSARQALEAMYPMAPTREWPAGRAILDRQVIHIRDYETEPWLSPAAAGPDGQVERFGPVDARRRGDRRARPWEPRARRLLRQPGRVAEDLRRAGGDRHHQRRDAIANCSSAPATSGVARIPDRDSDVLKVISRSIRASRLDCANRHGCRPAASPRTAQRESVGELLEPDSRRSCSRERFDTVRRAGACWRIGPPAFDVPGSQPQELANAMSAQTGGGLRRSVSRRRAVTQRYSDARRDRTRR